MFLTVAATTLPLLEPVYQTGDVANLLGLKRIGTYVDNVANALSPALRSLVNLGYSDAFWDPATGAYERTLDTAATPVKFGTLPSVTWSQALPHVFKQLADGFHTAFTTNTPVPNALCGSGVARRRWHQG